MGGAAVLRGRHGARTWVIVGTVVMGTTVTGGMAVLVPPGTARIALVGTLLVALALVAGIGGVRADSIDAARSQALALSWGLLQSAGDAVVAVDGQGRVVEWNPAAEAMFGYSRDDAHGREIASLVIPQDLRERHDAAFARAVAGEPLARAGRAIEFDAVTRDGQRFPVEVTISRVDAHRGVAFTAFIRDVTRRRELEAERAWTLRKLAQAQEQTRAQIASELHDDTVQVMVAVLMSLDRALARTVAGEQQPLLRARELLAEAIDRTRRMMFELRPAVLHERGLAAAVAVLADEIRRETGASVDVNIPYRRYPATVEALAYRSLQEALANVRKHANATTVSISLAEGGSDVLIGEVRDNGRGFDLDTTLTRTRAEMHLGLDTMIERVQTMGGTCTIDSHEGGGTRIAFRFPAQPPAPANPSRRAPTSATMSESS